MKNRTIWEGFFIAICLTVMAFLLVGSILQESPTYDEVTYVEAGYQFLVNKDFRFDPFSPPLAKEIIALPALFNKDVIYDKVIFWPRIIVVLFSISLALLVYEFSRQLFGGLSAKLSLILFIFEPNILAHGHYATADLIFTFFSILSLFCFWLWKKKFSYKKTLVFSIIIGLLLSTKLTSIPFIVLPLFILFVLENNRKLLKYVFWKKRIWHLLLIIVITLVTLWSTYFFKPEPLLGYRFDPNRPAIALSKNNSLIKILLTVPVPLGSYISTIKQIALFNYSNLYVKRSFFIGMMSLNGSPGYYFPLLFAIKTPISLLIIFILSLFFFYKDYKRGRYILVPLLLILLNVLFSKVALVNRYILPVYPLIIIYASQIVNVKALNARLYKILLGILLVWYVFGTIKAFPYFISYMNEFIGGKNNEYKYLIDSNYDWGQGLLALKNYQDNNRIKNLQFAYFGSINPVKYGIQYDKIENLSINDSKQVMALEFDKKHTIAISATCWYFCGYYKNPEFNKINPIDIVGGSILIFKR